MNAQTNGGHKLDDSLCADRGKSYLALGTVENYSSLNKNNINVPLVFFIEDKKTLKRVCAETRLKKDTWLFHLQTPNFLLLIKEMTFYGLNNFLFLFYSSWSVYVQFGFLWVMLWVIVNF